MLGTHIRYDELTSEIKSSINKKHNEILSENPEQKIEQTLESWFQDDFDSWLYSRISGMAEDSRRRHFRLNVELAVRILDTIIKSGNHDGEAADFIGKVLNISRGGLYFISSEPVELSSIIRVEIDLSQNDPELGVVEALAMVVRCEEKDNNNYGVSIMFSSIYDSEKVFLDLFILKQLSYYIYAK